MEKERINHPSYGMISFSRVNGISNFYGSELSQDHYIQMTLSASEQERDLSKDWFYPTNVLVKLRMTSGQFSEMITSMNKSGVPCTLEFMQGKIPQVEKIESRKEYTHRQFKERMKEFGERISKNRISAKEIIKKKTLSKDDMDKLNSFLDGINVEIESNLPFFAKCFQETMDKIVFEAKLEVENAIQHKINILGKDALNSQILESDTKTVLEIQ